MSVGRCVGRRWWRAIALSVALILAAPAPAAAFGFTQGRYTFGINGGFGKQSFSIGGRFGYLVVDGLQPSIALGYAWQGGDFADAHQLRTQLELRYYIIQGGSVAPYVAVDGQHVYLAYRGSVTENHSFFLLGGGGGVVFLVGENIGLELGVSLGKYLGADDVLYRRGTIEDGLVVTGRFGVTFIL